MKWDDLMIRFEWTLELPMILSNLQEEPEIKKAVEEAGQKLKFSFDEAMVQNWKA